MYRQIALQEFVSFQCFYALFQVFTLFNREFGNKPYDKSDIVSRTTQEVVQNGHHTSYIFPTVGRKSRQATRRIDCTGLQLTISPRWARNPICKKFRFRCTVFQVHFVITFFRSLFVQTNGSITVNGCQPTAVNATLHARTRQNDNMSAPERV